MRGAMRGQSAVAAGLAAMLLAGCAAGGEADDGHDEMDAESASEVADVYIVATDESYRPQSLYRFYPDEAEVPEGAMVNLTLKGAGGNNQPHTLVIDEFDVRLSVDGEFDTDHVVFQADQAGTYAFYCDVGNHRLLGMEGTFRVA